MLRLEINGQKFTENIPFKDDKITFPNELLKQGRNWARIRFISNNVNEVSKACHSEEEVHDHDHHSAGENGYPHFDLHEVQSTLSLLFLCPSGWSILSQTQETRNQYLSGTEEYEHMLEQFHIDGNFTAVFSEEQVQCFQFSELKNIEYHRADSGFERQEDMDVDFVENEPSDFQFQDGTYTGQMNNCKQKHGYGLWESEENEGERAFGNWFRDHLVDGTEIKMDGLRETAVEHQTLLRKLDVIHTNKYSCAVNIKLLKEVHRKANENKEKVKAEARALRLKFDTSFLFYLFENMWFLEVKK